MATVRTFPFVLPGADGGPLRGEIRSQSLTEARPAIVICHGFKGFKDWGFFPHVAARLAQAGIAAISFNFSGSGVGPDGESFSEPERFRRGMPSADLEDIRVVWDAVQGGGLVGGLAPPTVMGIFGHSRGGATALLHAAEHPECRALVTWAAISSYFRWGAETVRRWREQGSLDIVNQRTGEVLPLGVGYLEDLDAHGARLDLLDAARRVGAPWLIVHGSVDETVKVEEAKVLQAAARSAPTKLAVVDGGSHTLGARHPWDGSTPQLDRAMDLTVDWFVRNLFGG